MWFDHNSGARICNSTTLVPSRLRHNGRWTLPPDTATAAAVLPQALLLLRAAVKLLPKLLTRERSPEVFLLATPDPRPLLPDELGEALEGEVELGDVGDGVGGAQEGGLVPHDVLRGREELPRDEHDVLARAALHHHVPRVGHAIHLENRVVLKLMNS